MNAAGTQLKPVSDAIDLWPDASAAIADVLNRPAELWSFQEAWEYAGRVDDNRHVRTDCDGDGLPVTDSGRFPLKPRSASFVLDVGEDSATVGLYLGRQNKTQLFGVSTVREEPRVLLERLLNQNRRLEDQAQSHTEQLNTYSAFVSQDLEELTWLRSLAEHLECCELNNSVFDVAQRILPPLRSIIGSETVVFLPANTTDQAGSIVEGRLPAGSVWEGSPCITVEMLEHLIARTAAAADAGPVVINHISRNPEYNEFPGLRSCLVLRMASDDFFGGWLIALNRITVDDPIQTSRQAPNYDFSESEFGTIEASLLTSAAMMLTTHARNVSLFVEKEQLLIGVIRSLANAVDAKDSYTRGHSERVALMAQVIGDQVGLDPLACHQLYMAGLLHDVGKIGVPDQVLQKPGRLTDEEFEQIKQHPTIGHEILKHLKQLDYLLPGVLHHHERWDGFGYPHRLAAEDIPLQARILAVADAYDAMTSGRCYRQAMPREKAEAILKDGAGVQWDARLIEAFFSRKDEIQRVCEESDDHRNSVRKSIAEGVDNGEPKSDSNDRIVNAVTATRTRR